jgi:hypothetical protein
VGIGCAGAEVSVYRKGRVGGLPGYVGVEVVKRQAGTASEPASVTCHRHIRSKPAATPLRKRQHVLKPCTALSLHHYYASSREYV